jgi:hypothetical protein
LGQRGAVAFVELIRLHLLWFQSRNNEPLAKFQGVYKKCQGTTSVVPKDYQKDIGL